jgi:hypothetical protein
MLRHRLVDTQAEAGISLRNVGATVAGQIVYLSPLVAALAVMAAMAAWRGRRDPVGALLLTTFAVPLAALLPLCVWSRSAEPHWLAPSLIALVFVAARTPASTPRRLVGASCALAGALVMAVHAWVLSATVANLASPSADPRLDISNELYGWADVTRAVREEGSARRLAGLGEDSIAVVGPHWVICAQLDSALRGELPVGCNTPIRDDFDDWFPRSRWNDADAILWVTDGRFGPPPEFAGRVAIHSRRVDIRRGHRTVRTFTLTWLERRGLAAAQSAPQLAAVPYRHRSRGWAW